MKKLFCFTVMLALISVNALAQNRKITGTTLDNDSKEPIMQTTVQLLKTDSSFVSGGVSNADGVFSITAPADGKYIVKMSSVGYTVVTKNIQVSDSKDIALGNIMFKSDAVMLKGTTVTGQAAKVTLKKDTFIYKASAYRTPEGSTVEELVKRIPGAEVDDEGNITINGKSVKSIKIDGKEFMKGDTKTAIKNLPTSIINNIKAYDEKSDLSRVTGIDDGNDVTTLDFGVKKGMNKGFFSNVDLSIGTKGRYSERLMAAYFKDNFRIMGFGNANNTNDMGFGGGRGGFRNRNGLNASKMGGVNFNYENTGKLKLDGSVRWNHRDGDVRSKTSAQNFLTREGSDTGGNFSNSIDQSYSRSDSWNAQARIEWTPDTMTNIMFRPTMSFSKSDGRGWSDNASYSADPFQYVVDPLSKESMKTLADKNLMINSSTNNNLSYSDNKRFGGMLQLNRRLNNRGRNVTLRADANYNEGNSTSMSTNNVHLYRIFDQQGNDSTYQTNRYRLTPSKNWNYSLQTTYSEPLWKNTFLQMSYQFNYSYSRSDQSTYDFSNLGEDFFQGVTPIYRDWGSYLNRLQNPLDSYLDNSLSKYSEYKNYTHNIELMFRMIRPLYNFNVGVMMQPQRSNFVQRYLGVNTDTTRTVTNFSPTLDFRYHPNERTELRVNYRGTSSQPSMSQLLDITDDSNPLNIIKGNPGLKPSFSNNFDLFYRTTILDHMKTFVTHVGYSTTRNSIVDKVTYDQNTGGRITSYDNINGNWNANAFLMFNSAIDSAGYFNVNMAAFPSYSHMVGFLSPDRQSEVMKNITKSLNLGGRLGVSYRNSWLEVELNGRLTYRNVKNALQPNNNLDTWDFSYGTDVQVTMPWGTALSTNLHQNSRRGYNDAAFNTNELVWNAQISQSFLKNKPLTVMLQFYDLLHNQSNISRNISTYATSDTEYNSINSYAMLHINYRLNLFGDKNSRSQMGQGGFGGPGGRGGRGGFGRPGGGRPPRGGFGGPGF